MYINDSTLASTLHQKEEEFITETEPEILAEFKNILESDNFKADRAVIRAKATENYRKFLNDFCKEYAEQFEKENGCTYGERHPSRKKVLNEGDKYELTAEYKRYLKKILVK